MEHTHAPRFDPFADALTNLWEAGLEPRLVAEWESNPVPAAA